MEKKAYEPPKEGIFYLVPDPKTKKYTLYVEIDEESNPLHFNLWDRMMGLLASRFKVHKEALENAYTGIPRGRITQTSNGWVVAHGGDFSLPMYKSEIESEFSLGDATRIGKVKWIVDSHEKMGKNDRDTVQFVLGITLTPEGFTKKGKR